MKRIILIFLSSVLVFLSISFLSFLSQVSPFQNEQTSKLEIGFPKIFYGQFLVRESNFLNFGWSLKNLLIDFSICVIFVLFVNLVFYWKHKRFC
jgi:hypothetical protein